MERKQIFTFGEALWDCLPAGIFLGGAPVNVAYHLSCLGEKVAAMTSLGRDLLGNEAMERMENAGIDVSYVHWDNEWPTGAVKAKLTEKGNATYQFLSPVAWDRIIVTPALEEGCAGGDALVYGTLAQRSEHNRKTLFRLLEKDHWERIYDVNLRPPFDDPKLVFALAGKADLVKLNDDETFALSGLKAGEDDLQEAVRALAEKTPAQKICVTRGGEGALLWDRTKDSFLEEKGRTITVEDTVGAGDAFLAALVGSLLHEKPLEECLRKAARLGEYVATQRGAMPAYQVEKIPGFLE
ncbi:MAG: carbohydrate kinase [Opitutales bacterium]|nr:carbohydrate kinase [Opitutales bacterium]MCH8540713.1 carbohydrate kinase [Opitutales bacterium]